MKSCYINGIGSVGIQKLGFNLFEDQPSQLKWNNKAFHPDYKELIPAATLRRMSSGVKMGIYAALQAMKEAELDHLDAIITGTGMGCLQDSEKFLNSMIANQEAYLTPTSFIQSTHNTVAAQIALQLKCKAYNFTYVNGITSFEAALLDGMLQLSFQDAETILVGGIDETSSDFDQLFELSGAYKSQEAQIDFRKPESTGIAISEGANFFLLSNTTNKSTYAKVLNVCYFNHPRVDLLDEISGFLASSDLQLEDIDVLLTGMNADKNQQPYFEEISTLFSSTCLAYYQHLSGSFDTASAYGLRVAAEIIKNQKIPASIIFNDFKPKRIKTILLINQSSGKDYGLILVQSC